MSLASERFPLESLAAPIFVFIWSTGFIIARFGMPYMELYRRADCDGHHHPILEACLA